MSEPNGHTDSDSEQQAPDPEVPPTTQSLATRERKPIINFEAGRGLVAQDLDGLWRIGNAIAASNFCPKSLRQGPQTTANIVIACAQGGELGLTIMQSLQSIAVINGMPSIYGDAALALVRRSKELSAFEEAIFRYCPDCQAGQLTADADEFKAELKQIRDSHRAKKCSSCGKSLDSDDYLTAVCYSRRAGEPPTLRLSTFSVQDAKRSKLWGKAGPWTEYPQRMLMWRARGFNLRDNFGDILKGLYTYEEARDAPAEELRSEWAAPQEKPDAGMIPVDGTNVIDIKPEPQAAAPSVASSQAAQDAAAAPATTTSKPARTRKASPPAGPASDPTGEQPPAEPDPPTETSPPPVAAAVAAPSSAGSPQAPIGVILPDRYSELEPGDRIEIWLSKIQEAASIEGLAAIGGKLREVEEQGGPVREHVKAAYQARGKQLRGA